MCVRKQAGPNDGIITDIAVFTLWISVHSITEIMVRYLVWELECSRLEWHESKSELGIQLV